MVQLTELQKQQMKMADELIFSGKRTVSFAKLFFYGLFDADRIFPFPEPPREIQERSKEFLVRLKDTLEKHHDPVDIDKNARIPQSTIKALGDAGMMGLTIPKEHGGQGMTQYEYCKAMEIVAARCGGTGVFVNAHQSIGLRAILLFGNEEQKKLLPPLASGDELAAFALTEPEAGSDAANVKTKAVYDPVKKVFRINGHKRWITNGGIAKTLTLIAVDEGLPAEKKGGNITAFIVHPDMPGFRVVDPALEKVGIRGTMTAKLEFKDMEVPEENVLGKRGKGLKIGLTVLDYGRLTFGACCTGVAKECVKQATQHVKERVQFGQPIGKFQLVQEKIARMAALAYAMESATYITAGWFDRGEEDVMIETAMLKVFTSDSLWTIVNDTIQVIGGKAFFCDQPFERMMRDARLNTIGEGANEVMRSFLAMAGMGNIGKEIQSIIEGPSNPLTKLFQMLGFGGRFAKQALRAPKVPVKSPQLEDEAAQLGAAIRHFGLSVMSLLRKHRELIMEEQLAQDRIATSAMAIYTAAAVISRLDSAIQKAGGNVNAVGDELATGRLYLRMALKQINDSLGSLTDNGDKFVLDVAKRLTGL
ncbi:acyl-CoA dehydrogenase family protein [bacterium]|jgi:alkylation response protein AidB-like acyl-CoA dehydrogenase|nr:acyl-CoA dehydrogenase family protein [bacterium]